MKISYNWLKSYIAIDLSAEKVAEILTDTGLEVESVQKVEAVTGGLEGVVIGQVMECNQHPDADRLKLTQVNVGSDELLQIVCGAPNVLKGQKVVVATPGCTLYPEPDKPFKIKPTKIRGVESNGMLCAEDELGLGESHDGIIVLDESAPIGTKASEFFELQDDYLFEIGLTPNRSDAMGHIGVARDLIAYLNFHENAGLKLQLPSVEEFKVYSNELLIDVQVDNHELCPRYQGTSISGVKIASSPEWLQKKLRTIGLTPRNNVVDVTNFVMHELGNPLHAFDADKLQGKIVVKTAISGAKFQTLDETERVLADSNLMITNGSENLCIAGVFGGLHSGISESTVNVFLEAAYFNPVTVRKTAKMHGLSTDSSFRFERGVDPSMTEYAMKRAALLIQEIAGGIISMEPVDIYPTSIQEKELSFDLNRCRKLIGAAISNQDIIRILETLDIVISSENGDELTVKVPLYRVDVTREADLIEEVLRIYGFNNIDEPQKLNTSLSYRQMNDVDKIKNVVSETLVGMGFHEAMNNSLTKASYIENHGGEALKSERNVEILNPLSNDLSVMRQSLIFNALEMVEHNQNRQHPNLRLFEFGKVYHRFDSGFSENQRLLLLISGKQTDASWNEKGRESDFYALKGIVMALMNRMGFADLIAEKEINKSLLEDGIQLSVLKNKVGELGWVSAKMKKSFGIKSDVFIADLDWDKLMESLQFTSIKYKELPKTFAVRRDFSLLLDRNTAFGEIERLAKSCERKLLKEVGLFDVYQGDKLATDKKSYAVSFTFQDDEKTLQDQQIDQIMTRIKEALEKELNAQLR